MIFYQLFRDGCDKKREEIVISQGDAWRLQVGAVETNSRYVVNGMFYFIIYLNVYFYIPLLNTTPISTTPADCVPPLQIKG